MTVLVGSDLDRTLIYSRGAVERWGDGGSALVAVERYRDADASWLTAAAAAAFAELGRRAVVVPVTTRTPEQLARVRLPGPSPAFAICANGGVLLAAGEPDAAWQRRVTAAVASVAPLAEVVARAEGVLRPEWTTALREAHGLFCYAVVERDRLPDGFLDEVTAWAGECGWQVSLQGRKLYWVPRPLTKSAALAEVAARTGTTRTLAAGDSLLDADLLDAADAGIAARHGELVESGWAAAHVVVTAACGVRAGEEIVRWLAGQL